MTPPSPRVALAIGWNDEQTVQNKGLAGDEFAACELAYVVVRRAEREKWLTRPCPCGRATALQRFQRDAGANRGTDAAISSVKAGWPRPLLRAAVNRLLRPIGDYRRPAPTLTSVGHDTF